MIMADDVRMTSQGGNGERLDVRVGGQSFGLSAKDLIPILLLIVAGVAGYLVYHAQDQRFGQMQEQHLMLFRHLQHQNEVLNQHSDVFRRWLTTIDYNIGHPEQRIPLEAAPPPPPVPALPSVMPKE
jgi:hypothetical protein